MSILLVLAGLFPPKRTPLDWNKNLNWQPVPYSYTAQVDDALVLMLTSCPRYHEELGRVFEEDLEGTLDEYAEMFQELSNITGWNVTSAADVASLYSTLKCEAISSCYDDDSWKFILTVLLLERLRARAAVVDGEILSRKASSLKRQKLLVQGLQQRIEKIEGWLLPQPNHRRVEQEATGRAETEALPILGSRYDSHEHLIGV